MAILHPRAFKISVPKDDTFHSSFSSKSIETTLPDRQPKTSWIARFAENIPGYSWLKHKIGTFIYGPTYGMTRAQLRAYRDDEAKQEQIELLIANRDADFKVAMYMALKHPKFYWHKYIDTFEKGTDERKKGLLLFVLANKREIGDYYGGMLQWKRRIDEELSDFGITLGEGTVKEYTERRGRVNIGKRDAGEKYLKSTGGDIQMLEDLERTVAGVDISRLQPSRNLRKTRAVKRTFKVADEGYSFRPHFD